MAVEVLTMNPVLSDVLKMEPEQRFGREVGTLLTGLNGKIGMVLAKRTVDPTAANTTTAARAGNTGNGTITKDATAPVGANAWPGVYTVTFVEPVTNLGTFQVFRPDGSLLGTGVVGTAFDSEVKFAIADGSTDFVAGDGFRITVPAGDGKLVHCVNDAQNNGTHRPWGVLLEDVDATDADMKCVVLRRGPAIVRDAGLVWHSSIDDATKKGAKLALLEAQQIVARASA